MIITCPDCDTRFVVPSTVFMKGGRKLKCASCKHSWFHDPSATSTKDEEDALTRAIDGQEKSDNSKSSKNILGHVRRWGAVLKSDMREGYKVILCFFLLVIGVYSVFHFTKSELIIGQGIAFDNIEISRPDSTSITINGSMVNTTDSIRGIPDVHIEEILNNDIIGDKIIHSPMQETLESGEILEFSIVMDDVPNAIKDLKITFGQSVEDSNH